jgi:hypothetical protein
MPVGRHRTGLTLHRTRPTPTLDLAPALFTALPLCCLASPAQKGRGGSAFGTRGAAWPVWSHPRLGFGFIEPNALVAEASAGLNSRESALFADARSSRQLPGAATNRGKHRADGLVSSMSWNRALARLAYRTRRRRPMQCSVVTMGGPASRIRSTRSACTSTYARFASTNSSIESKCWRSSNSISASSA